MRYAHTGLRLQHKATPWYNSYRTCTAVCTSVKHTNSPRKLVPQYITIPVLHFTAPRHIPVVYRVLNTIHRVDRLVQADRLTLDVATIVVLIRHDHQVPVTQALGVRILMAELQPQNLHHVLHITPRHTTQHSTVQQRITAQRCGTKGGS